MTTITTTSLFWLTCLSIQVFWCEASQNNVRHNDSSSNGFCLKTDDCIAKIKKMIPDTTRFWFGEQWKDNCVHQNLHKKNSIQCLNPKEMSNYYSLGSRLFRDLLHFSVRHLQSLRPQFSVDLEEGADVEVHPNSHPIPSFQLQHPPSLDWPQLRPNDSLILLFFDVGFGTLKGLAVDYPRATRFIYEYEPLENFRLHQPTPLAVLVFRPEVDMDWDQQFHHTKDSMFDLSQFMIEFQLEEGLIGLNWFLVAGDAYSIERQRLKGLADNCHALIQTKLIQDRRWGFVESFSLTSMDSSLSISALHEQSSSITACCTPVTIERGEIFADPLADKRFPSTVLLKPPKVTSLRSLETLALNNYQRSYRHYVVLKEERYTLVMFDPIHNYLHWMIVDITSESLSSGNLETETLVVQYMSPIPKKANTCLFAVFILFKQPSNAIMSNFYNSDHALRSKHCVGHCTYRVDFEIEQFASFHRLQLSGISWIEVCYDLFEASRQIQSILQNNTNTTNSKTQQTSKNNNSLKRRFAGAPKAEQKYLAGKPSSNKMDGIIQMMPPFMRKYSTYIDFEGQRKAERIFQVILVVHGIVGFIAGYATQQLSVTMYSIGVGFILSCLFVLPPWPMFRRNSLNWHQTALQKPSQVQHLFQLRLIPRNVAEKIAFIIYCVIRVIHVFYYIDFEGQRKAERIFQVILVVHGIVVSLPATLPAAICDDVQHRSGLYSLVPLRSTSLADVPTQLFELATKTVPEEAIASPAPVPTKTDTKKRR
uniref:Signal peptidase complex subunit 1 n=1 Tax=Ditylenchus dipsaci TaxID=166011 RepID=A0A915DHQ4_9BILA